MPSSVACSVVFLLAAGVVGGSPPNQDARPAAAKADEHATAVEAAWADDAVVARGFDTAITWKELEPLLVARRAMSKDGRDALLHLSKSRLLEQLAKEQGVEPSDAVVDARLADIEKQLIAAGRKDGLEGEMRRAHVTRAEFKHLLKLAIVHETLTRRSLNKRENEPVTSEQQDLYLDETLKERGFEMLRAPWKDGVAATASGLTVSSRDFLVYLRRGVAEEDLREDAYQMLLQKRVLARMPDLAPDKLAQYVKEELDRRRTEFASDPKHKGVTWEQMLAAQGVLPERMPDDPGVRLSALARLWVERSYDDATLKRVYADEREHFDATFGAAIDVRMIFLRGADLPRDGELRTFKAAETKLAEIQQRVRSIEDFEREAKQSSEDAQTCEKGGELGFVTAGNPRVPEAIRVVVKQELAKNPTLAASSAGSMSGPVRMPNGSALLWLGARRAVPSWEQMSRYVQRELRQRFLDEVLPRAKMVMELE